MGDRRTIAALAGGLLAGLLGVASGSPVPMVHAPAGWRADAERAAELGKGVAASRPFGDPAATSATEVYVPTDGAAISLIVSRATSRAPGLDRGAAAAATIADLHGIVARAKLSGGTPTESGWSQAVDPERQLRASLAWADPSVGTHEDAALVIAADAAALVGVTGECVAGSAAPAAAVTACKAALATLDPGIPAPDRVAIPPPSATPPPTAGSDDLPTTPSHPQDAPARLDDGGRISLPPIVIPQDAPADRRPVFVGAGIAVLAAAFWWNRKNRERFAPEDGAAPPRKDPHD